MACIKGLLIVVELSICIAEAFDAADVYLLSSLQSLDTHGRNRIVF